MSSCDLSILLRRVFGAVPSDCADEPVPRVFQKYLLSGGMPYLANLRFADEPSRQYLYDLFNSVQLKDIVRETEFEMWTYWSASSPMS